MRHRENYFNTVYLADKHLSSRESWLWETLNNQCRWSSRLNRWHTWLLYLCLFLCGSNTNFKFYKWKELIIMHPFICSWNSGWTMSKELNHKEAPGHQHPLIQWPLAPRPWPPHLAAARLLLPVFLHFSSSLILSQPARSSGLGTRQDWPSAGLQPIPYLRGSAPRYYSGSQWVVADRGSLPSGTAHRQAWEGCGTP